MKVLVTGAQGFIAKNLIVRLSESEEFEIIKFSRQSSMEELFALLPDIDVVVHLAGVNRSSSPADFVNGNIGLTETLCQALTDCGRQIPIIFTSSIQADRDNDYGISKLSAENLLWKYANQSGASVYVYRLPNVFGKWCRPNYNSVVATFCHNIAHGLPIQINDHDAILTLVYVDDVVDEFIRVIIDKPKVKINEICFIPDEYRSTVGELARQIALFRDSRDSLITDHVGTGLVRALYSTYMSYMPPESFSYKVQEHADTRGLFVEILRTKDSGQFSFFTAYPGITRGEHYHHSKTEKFLVVRGKAHFGFRNILTDETYELITSSEQFQIVETIPGWSHNITNVGEDEMMVFLWANEIYDRSHPDTIASKV